MHWLKIHHGFSTDPKLGLIAHQLKTPRAIINAIVVDILEHASKQCPRGCVVGYDEESAAYNLGIDIQTLRNVTEVLRNKSFVTDGCIANWAHYQSAIDKTGAERQARHRARLKEEIPLRNVTNALRNTEERRGEEKKGAKAPAPILPDWLDHGVWESYRDMRKRIRKPLTAHAEKLAIGKLDEWRKQGHNPSDIINNSVMNGYQGLIEPKGRNFQKSPQPQYANRGMK